MDYHVRVRPRPRVWLFLRAATDDAVRGSAFADVARRLQRRRRAGTDSGAGAGDPAPRAVIPRCLGWNLRSVNDEIEPARKDLDWICGDDGDVIVPERPELRNRR